MTYIESKMIRPLVSSSAIEMPGCVNTFSGIGNESLTDKCPYDVVQRRPFTHESNNSDGQSDNVSHPHFDVYQRQQQTSKPSTSQNFHSLESTDDFSTKKEKFLFSFWGKFVPRPSDGVPRYVGGHTRIINLWRGIRFQELQKMVDVYGQRMVIKYQLPNEDLDTLISVSCDEDLQNMMEYDTLLKTSPARSRMLHVFLFSASEPDCYGVVQFANHQDSGQQ
ncbi:hypothetical protein AMTRI_Chr12g236980 [Amborella trichopoda]|uniref:PB1 domain-containing protein n=1 Tax=Amborella trichopoda TaxID=13333 RepID=W1PQP7_AMBTC|nr:hypothetical protein AMTR_s00026p00131400 [Amborella trichopoda]